MKQIFDWLREQIITCRDGEPTLREGDECFNNGLDYALKKIDKAEAKWEAECCEWEYNDIEEKWETSCGVLFKLHDSDREITNFCSCCGKKIKVVE